MSGGSWDYFTFKAVEVSARLKKEKSPLRRALGAHMEYVAKAMYDIEWVDSGDKSPGDEREAIKTVLGDTAETKEMDVLLKDARSLINSMKKLGA